MRLFGLLLAAVVMLTSAESAFAQKDAGSKMRGEVYNFHGSSAGRSMRSARGYSQDYRHYARSAPAKKVEREVARDTADSIGDYIAKAQKHMAKMRKHAEASDDKAALASLDSIDKNLATAAKEHKKMHDMCMKDDVDSAGTMDCCQRMDDSLKAAIEEHGKLMKRTSGDKPASK